VQVWEHDSWKQRSNLCICECCPNLCESPEFYDVDSFTAYTPIITVTSVSPRGTRSSLRWMCWNNFHAVKPGTMACSLSLDHYDDPRPDCRAPSNCNCLCNYYLYLVIRIMPCVSCICCNIRGQEREKNTAIIFKFMQYWHNEPFLVMCIMTWCWIIKY
jgi:hypothetical protein